LRSVINPGAVIREAQNGESSEDFIHIFKIDQNLERHSVA